MRTLLWRLVVVLLAVAAGRWISAPAAHAGPEATPRLSLPAPTGPHRCSDISVVFSTGPIDGVRAVSIQRRYLTAWFDWALRGRARPLLRGESTRFPEVDFQP